MHMTGGVIVSCVTFGVSQDCVGDSYPFYLILPQCMCNTDILC